MEVLASIPDNGKLDVSKLIDCDHEKGRFQSLIYAFSAITLQMYKRLFAYSPLYHAKAE